MTITLSEGPSYLAVTPDGTEVYALCNDEEADGIVAIIDTATSQVSATVNVGGFPQALVFAADGNTAYEVNDPAHDVSVIDTASESVVSKLPTKQLNAGGLALAPNGNKLYVTGDSTFVAVLSPGGGGSRKILLPQSTGFSIPALTPNGKYLYVPASVGGGQSVYMIEASTHEVVGNPITVGSQPWKIAIASNARRAYVTNYADGTVSVINISL
jgi:YVTN family beta-propeller protein